MLERKFDIIKFYVGSVCSKRDSNWNKMFNLQKNFQTKLVIYMFNSTGVLVWKRRRKKKKGKTFNGPLSAQHQHGQVHSHRRYPRTTSYFSTIRCYPKSFADNPLVITSGWVIPAKGKDVVERCPTAPNHDKL